MDLKIRIGLLGILCVMLLAGCSTRTSHQSALSSVLNELNDKQMIAKADIKNGIVIFMKDDQNNLHSGLVFGPSYSTYCGGGRLPLSEKLPVSSMYTDCNDADGKKSNYVSLFTGILNNDAIDSLELKYKAGKKEFKQKAEILKSKEGMRVWFVKPEKAMKDHLTLSSITGYSGDGKVLYSE